MTTTNKRYRHRMYYPVGYDGIFFNYCDPREIPVMYDPDQFAYKFPKANWNSFYWHDVLCPFAIMCTSTASIVSRLSTAA